VLDSRLEQQQTVAEARLLRAAFAGWWDVTKRGEGHRKEVRCLARCVAFGHSRC
jgi:hypothetical protein